MSVLLLDAGTIVVDVVVVAVVAVVDDVEVMVKMKGSGIEVTRES